MPTLAFLLKGTGALLILHAGYSCMHYRSILMDLDLLDATSSSSSSAAAGDGASSGGLGSEATTSMMIPPVDVYIEVALAFGLLLLGQLLGMGPLQSVELVSSTENQDTTSSNSTSKNERHKPLAAQAYKTRDFDVYNNRSRMLLHRATAASAKTR